MGSMWFSDHYGIFELPVTVDLLSYVENVRDRGIWLVIPLLIIYYAGELVGRERDARLNEIIGAALANQPPGTRRSEHVNQQKKL